MKKKSAVRPLAFKDTFWNRLRVENNITIKELASYLHLSDGAVGMYLTGQTMASESVIKQLCDYFSVDLLKGTQEFEKAHKAWDAEHKRTLRVKGGSIPTGVKSDSKPAEKPAPEKSEVLLTMDEAGVEVAKNTKFVSASTEFVSTSVKKKVLKATYGKVKMDLFLEYYDNAVSDPLGFFYGKVDYPVYQEIEDAIGGKSAVSVNVVAPKVDPWEIP